MAKSKSGGTRSYIRGKIGADVYSIGKNGKGNKQQVVRSLAEVVSNPQTEAQMKGRMIMSTVMQALSALTPIVDHSFDNRPSGQPNLSEFISRNYALVKADAEAHPASGNFFGLNKYQEKGAKGGKYIISYGVVPTPSGLTVTINDAAPALEISLGKANATVADMLEVLGLSLGDYFTLVCINSGGTGMSYARFLIKSNVATSTVVNTSNFDTIFDVESNVAVTPSVESNTLILELTASVLSAGAILSRKINTGWEHNTATMVAEAGQSYASDNALPTYPQGSARFLNGGDI